MVQEVQIGVGQYNETTLETIEAVGTSSRKIIEGRQTRGEHYSSMCTASGAAYWTYTSDGSRGSPSLQASLSLNSMTGKEEYQTQTGCICVPSAGTYQISVTRWGGVPSNHSVTVFVRKGDTSSSPRIFQKTSSTREQYTDVFVADLGKFDLVSLRFEYYYSGSAAGASLGDNASIKIQQL